MDYLKTTFKIHVYVFVQKLVYFLTLYTGICQLIRQVAPPGVDLFAIMRLF